MSDTKFSYYSLDRLLSHGGIINMAVGARGLGKTYSAKRLAIRNAIRKGEEFVYLRRFKTELKHVSTFFNDIAAEFPEFEFRVTRRTAAFRRRGDEESPWRTIGYFIALSSAATLKSVSYPKVTTLIFDEFIIETGSRRYLPGEVDTFLDLYSTIDRNDDRVRVLMLSNAVRCVNPYFVEWHLNAGKRFQKRGRGYIVCEIIDNAEFASQVSATRFGRFIRENSPEYAKYAIDNAFSDDTPALLGRKPPDAVLAGIIRTRGGSFSVWVRERKYWVQKRLPKDARRWCYAVRPDDGETLLSRSHPYTEMMRAAFRNGRMRFDCVESREVFWSVML